MEFLYSYIRSMRLYYCFVTGAATLAGIAIAGPAVWSWGVGVTLAIGFLAWGVNQILNDWSDREEDRINAPHRPMVTGELPANPAAALSCAIMLAFGVIAFFITPWTLLPIGLGFLFNLAYSETKDIPLLGNAFYAVSISMCTPFGFWGAGGELPGEYGLALVLLPLLSGFLALSHFLMCLYSTLKDVTGDRAAGKRTLAVVIGNRKTRLVCGILASAVLMLYTVPLWWAWDGWLFYLLGWGWCVYLAVRNMIQFARKRMHRATKSNCQSCVAQQLLAVCLFTPWGLAAMATAWAAIELLFRWYSDEKE